MKTKALVFALLAAVSAGSLAAAAPAIRYTSEAPFRDGKPVESVWNRADRIGGFVTCLTLDTPTWDTEAKLLFDEKNLYLTVRCPFEPKYVQKNLTGGIGHLNNIEISIQSDVNAGDYVHVMFDTLGRVHTDRTKAVCKLPVTVAVENGTNFWRGNVTIPFKALGIAAPKADRPVRVLIARLNKNVPRDYKLFGNLYTEATANVPMVRYDFGVPEVWEEMTLTREKASARWHRAPARDLRVNLIRNSEFNAGFIGWNAYPCTTWQETQALSGQWVAHVSGPGYAFLTVVPTAWKEDEEYTLCVKARSFGAGAALRIIEQGKDPVTGKGPREGTYLTGNLAVGPEFHTYCLPFRTKKGLKPWYLAFLKVDSGAKDSGVDIDSVKLYRGRIAPFEIRKIGFAGRGAITPGTGIAPKACPYGEAARPLRVLAVVRREQNQREVMCLFAGTGARVDILQANGKNEDVYGTCGDPKAVTARLEKGDYDLYMIGKDREKAMGPKLRELIAKNVKAGAKRYDPPKTADIAWGSSFLEKPKGDDRGIDDFPHDGFYYAELCERLWTLALGAPAISADAKTVRTEIVRNGCRHVVTKVTDAAGRTLSWKRDIVPVEGPKLGTFTDDDTTSTVVVSNATAGLTFAWEFSDFSDRVLAKGESSVQAIEQSEQSNNRTIAIVSFIVPRKKLYTNQGLIRMRLMKGDRLMDERVEDVYVRGNDVARLWNDYVVSMWPPGDGVPGEAQVRLRQLEEIGFNASIFGDYPWGIVRSLKSGLAMGEGYAGGGDIFHPFNQKTRVRAQQFNTAASRKAIAAKAEKVARRAAKYGPLHTAVCDETGMSRPWDNTDELDAHPENLVEYRRRMEAKYGTIAEYNRRHETAHKGFADVGEGLLADARARKSAAEFIEWRNFNCDRWVEAIRIVCDNVDKGCPGLKTSLYESFGPCLFGGNDYWKLVTKAGLGLTAEYTSMVYFDQSPKNNFDEFYRSFDPEMRVWGFTGYFFNRQRMSFMPWWFACHRYGGFTWYSAMGMGYNAMSNPGYEITLDGKELKESLEKSRLLDGLGKVLTVWKWAPHDTCIYYSYDSYLLSGVLGKEVRTQQINDDGPLHDHMYSRQGAQYVLEELLYQYDFIAPEQVVKQDRLARCKALLMPRVIAMSDAEVAQVKAYLAKGGQMLCDVLPGDHDELGVKRAANPFAGLKGVTVLGKNFTHSDADRRAKVRDFLQAAGATPALVSPTIFGHHGREAMHYVSGAADLYAVIPRTQYPDYDEADTFVFAKKGHVYDVRNWKYLGETDRVTAVAPKYEAAVYAVLPAKVAGISVNAPKSVTRGTDLRADFTIEQSNNPNNRTIPAYVLHVEVVPPSGKPRFHFKRNLMTEGGKAHLDFAMALNDEPGTWKLRVTEPLTGVTSERSFVLAK